MSSTYEKVRARLLTLLSDPDHKVIALRGKWGTGKTHLWRSLPPQNIGSKKPPIYISAFGVRSIRELKLRILQGIGISDESAFKKIADTGAGVIAGLLKRFAGYSAEDGALLWISSFVNGRLIVIDDIERKHSTLDTDEIMGFLNEYSDSHEARFLLLLNVEKLLDDKLWATLHEKVIDGEVILSPLPGEIFDIASQGGSESYLSEARIACIKLNLTNIRISRRILRVLKFISRSTITHESDYRRWIPSTVLLVAIHYRGIEGAPTFDFIRSFHSNVSDLEDDSDDSGARWRRMMEDIGLVHTDEYELLVMEYLQNGTFDSQAINNIFARHKNDRLRGNFYTKRHDFYTAYWWDPSISDQELREIARELLPDTVNLSASEVSEFVGVLDQLPDPELSAEVVQLWLASANDRPELQALHPHALISESRNIHSAIRAKLIAINRSINSPLSLTEAVEHIAESRSWGNREKETFANSTVTDYESAISTLKLQPLRTFIFQHLDWQSEQTGVTAFMKGVENFVQACKNINEARPDSRLAHMIRRSFSERRKLELILP